MLVIEPEKKIPVVYDVDVVVAGGGIAGAIAALAAARNGAKTLVIERFGSFGGNMGPGMFGGGSVHYALQDDEALVNEVGLGGIPEEFLRRIIFSRPNANEITEEMSQKLESAHLNIPELRVRFSYYVYAFIFKFFQIAHLRSDDYGRLFRQ